jgi:hypothetical protein
MYGKRWWLQDSSNVMEEEDFPVLEEFWIREIDNRHTGHSTIESIGMPEPARVWALGIFVL